MPTLPSRDPRRSPVPRNSHGAAWDVADVRAAELVSRHSDVLDPDERGLRPADVAPPSDPRDAGASDSTRAKKLLAERNVRCPPRLRYSVTGPYSAVVTYSWWPGKTMKS